MSRKNKKFPWRPNDVKDEVLVPESLRVAFWVARALSALPARLRRDGTSWWLSVSPPLSKIQRLFAAVNCILFVVLTAHLVVKGSLGQISIMCFDEILKNSEICLVVLIYVLCVCNAQGKLKLMISLLQEMQKINTYVIFQNKSKLANKLIIGYILWLLLVHVGGTLWELAKQIINNKVDVVTISYYQFVLYYIWMGRIIRLIISVIMFEITSTITLLSDQLEHILTSSNTFLTDIKLKLYLEELKPQRAKISSSSRKDSRPLKDDMGQIHYINQCHGAICDMVAQIDHFDGPFLLFSIMLIFLELMIIPQSFLPRFGSWQHMTSQHVTYQTNRFLINFTDLMIIVEPCQRLRNQMDRTRSLLGRLIGQDQRCGFDPAQLELFILQAKLRDAALAPMGVINVGRPLVASMIGGVVTFLIIAFQIENASQFL